jgi:hypothetical protein
VIGEGVCELDSVTDGDNEEKTKIFDEESHVESIFVLFWFSGSSRRSCDMATSVAGFV